VLDRGYDVSRTRLLSPLGVLHRRLLSAAFGRGMRSSRAQRKRPECAVATHGRLTAERHLDAGRGPRPRSTPSGCRYRADVDAAGTTRTFARLWSGKRQSRHARRLRRHRPAGSRTHCTPIRSRLGRLPLGHRFLRYVDRREPGEPASVIRFCPFRFGWSVAVVALSRRLCRPVG
jgi:hypothetical protein